MDSLEGVSTTGSQPRLPIGIAGEFFNTLMPESHLQRLILLVSGAAWALGFFFFKFLRRF